MKAAAVMLALVAVACAAREGAQSAAAPAKNPRKTVWLLAAPRAELEAACSKGNMPKRILEAAAGRQVEPMERFGVMDVLIPEELLTGEPAAVHLPFSCVGRRFFEHKAQHTEHGETVIRLSKRDRESALFRSVEPFSIERIEDREKKFLDYPFDRKMLLTPTADGYEHETGPFEQSVPIGTVFKVVFKFRGFRIDPDVECRP